MRKRLEIPGGIINPKHPRGIESQRALLEKEDHKITQKRKQYLIADYKTSLLKILGIPPIRSAFAVVGAYLKKKH